jgi:hypothetical protein
MVVNLFTPRATTTPLVLWAVQLRRAEGAREFVPPGLDIVR